MTGQNRAADDITASDSIVDTYLTAYRETREADATERDAVAAAQDALAAAHRAGYEQAIDNLRDRTRYLDWWSGPGAAGRGQTAHDHLADTYEIPA